jgi:AmiR/NasT family two-component response regulator
VPRANEGGLRLRIVIANTSEERLAHPRDLVTSLGHEVVLTATNLDALSHLTAEVQPDVALVGLSGDSPDVLALLDRIVQQAACPVIMLLDAQDPAFVLEAAKRGVFAYLVENGGDELQSALDVVLRRFAEYHQLEGAFGRRAITERAKGILMERHGIDDREAFELLRDHARSGSRRVVDVAQAILDGHALLPRRPSRD